MTERASHEARFIDLETKLSFQERTLAVLNEVVTEQQDSIDRLKGTLEAMTARIEVLTASMQEGGEDPR